MKERSPWALQAAIKTQRALCRNMERDLRDRVRTSGKTEWAQLQRRRVHKQQIKLATLERQSPHGRA